MALLHVQTFPQPLRYAEGLALQKACVRELAARPERCARLMLLRHTPVYTLGRRTKDAHLSMPERELAARSGAEVVRADRGGSVTYHGPGQLTAYLILHLKAWEITIHRHLWNLEEAALRTLLAFGVEGRRIEGMTGVWARGDGEVRRAECGMERAESLPGRSEIRNPQSEIPSPPFAKVCAIGVGCRRWVTYHGLGLNVDLDLSVYRPIDPCGLGQRPVTSLAKLLDRPVSMREAEAELARACAGVLGANIVRMR